MDSGKFLLPLAASWVALVTLSTNPALSQTDDYRNLFDGRTIDFELPAETVRAKSLFAEGNDKIAPGIRELVAEGSDLGARGFGALAKDLAVPLASLRSVAVSLTPERGSSVEDLIQQAEAHGADVTFVFGDTVYAHVPLDAVSSLGGSEDLYFMNRQTEVRPAYPALAAAGSVGEGVRSVGADRLHAAGITGKGVKVGILDFGFQRYSELQRKGLLPAPAAARAFHGEGSFEALSLHGTACAEIVHAMAPDAQLYLAAVRGTEEQLMLAAAWLVEQGVDIISFSGGTHSGPHNGKATLDRLVEMVTQQGILWVNAAGNEGASHWSGNAVDRNGDGWIDIGPGGENFMVIDPADDTVAMEVTWDDWGTDPSMPSSTEDIDAFLFRYDPRTETADLVDKSVNPQRGRGEPTEFLVSRVSPKMLYVLALQASSVTRQVLIHIYSHAPANLMPAEPRGSIGIPATSEVALAVGAVDVRTNKLEKFSSQGPTDDGRLKPEVSAPDNTLSATYSSTKPSRFPGTSASCPHVAGYAALLKEMQPQSSAPELRQSILSAARPASSGSPDYGHGHGYLDASRLDLEGESSTTLALPQAWGGRVTERAIDAFLERSRRDRDLEVKVTTGSEEYRLGDGLKIGFMASEDCYYLLLGRDSDGRYVAIAPFDGESPRLEAGEKYLLPQGDGVIRITEPTGTDEIILIGSRDRVDLSDQRSAGEIAVANVAYRVVR